MATQEFNIIPDVGCSVQRVGYRPTLVTASTDYNVKVCPSNGENGVVKVVVKGEPEDIRRFWEAVKTKKIMPPLKKNLDGRCVAFDVSEPLARDNLSDSDIDYCLDALQLDQSRSGVEVITALGVGVEDMSQGMIKLSHQVKKATEIMLSRS